MVGSVSFSSADREIKVTFSPALVQVNASQALGAGAVAYVHNQVSPATTWIVNHNFGFWPIVEVVNSVGEEIIAEVVHASLNQARVYWAQPQTGLVRCI
jgi:hypothetical protein